MIDRLPVEVETTLVEIADWTQQDPPDYPDLIGWAATELRDELLAENPRVSVTIPLAPDLQAEPWRRPQRRLAVRIADRRLVVDLTCRTATPTASEVDAIERIYEAVADARDQLRAAFLQANRAAHQTANPLRRREVTSMTGMDPGPSGPGLPVPDDKRPTPDDPSGEPE